MDFIAEFVMELLGDIIMEGGEDAASNHRLPKWLRTLILIGLALFYAAIFAIILLVGIGAFRDLPWMSALLFALDAMLVLMAVHKFRKILRTFPRK